MNDDKNQQTPITVQPFDQQSLNSSAKKSQQGQANSGHPAGRGQAAQGSSPDSTAGPTATQGAPKTAPGKNGPVGDSDSANQSKGPQAPPPDPASMHTFRGYHYPVPPAPMPTGPTDGPYSNAYGFDTFPSPDGDFYMPETKKKSNVLLIGIIACIIAIVILIMALLIIEFKPFGLFSDDFTAEPPSDIQIEDEFERGTLPKPDLGVFRYVDTTGLEMVELGDYDVGDVQYAGAGKDRKATCEASATATYENENIMVVQPLYVTMTYDRDNKSWTGSNIRSGTVEAAPMGPPDASLIMENLPNILKSYDASLATLYDGADITEESTLNENGGTIVFTLTKMPEGTPDNPEEGAAVEPLVCTVNSEISWNESLGWVVRINSVDGDIASGETATTPDGAPGDNPNPQTPPADNGGSNPPAGSGSGSGSGGSGGSSGNGGGATTITTETEVQILQLVCNTGDLVEIPGTIHFDNGRVLIRTDDEIRVIFNGAVYTVNYFELQGTGSWTNGQHTVVIGTVSATGTLPQAPLVISF